MDLLFDVRQAARSLARRRSYAVIAVLTLAAGIATTTTAFSVFESVLLRPLPYANADRLTTIWRTFPHWRGEAALDAQWDRIGLSWEDYTALRAGQQSFDQVGVYATRDVVIEDGERPEQRTIAKASASLMPMLGVQPQLGRWLLPEEEGPGTPRVAVLSHEYWQQRFGGDRSAIGRTVRTFEGTFEIVGVLPARLPLSALGPLNPHEPPAVWLPIGTREGDFTRNSTVYEAIGILRAGVTFAQAEADVLPLVRGERDPERNGVKLVPRLEAETAVARQPLRLLLLAVSALLLLACVNVAALQLAEAGARAPEAATRIALGAGRARIMAHSLTESALLAGAAALVGIASSVLILRVVTLTAPADLPRIEQLSLSTPVLLFATTCAVLTALLSGALPALSLARAAADLSRRSTRHVAGGNARTHRALLATQVALTVVLLVSAGLFNRSLLRQSATAVGFATDGVIAIQTVSSAATSEDAIVAARNQLAALADLPGVGSAALTSIRPFGGYTQSWAYWPEHDLRGPSIGVVHREVISANYFDAIEAPLLEGRRPTPRTGSDTIREAVVNSAFVQRFHPDGNAIGRVFRVPNGIHRIVGVVPDLRTQAVDAPPEATFYELFDDATTGRVTYVLNTEGDAAAVARRAVATLQRVDPTIAITTSADLGDARRATLRDERFRTALVTGFGLLAALIAAVGIGGSVLRAAARRRRELSIRMAIGASPREAALTLLQSDSAAVLAGLVAGIAAAAMTTRLIRGYLYDVAPTDPAAFVMAAGTMMVAAALAMAPPALRLRRLRLIDELRGE